MRIEERREMAEGVISYLKNEGYIRLSGKINNRTGECQVLMRRGSDDQIWVNIRDQPLSPVEEFCNECSEVHALAMGLIHSITQRSPTPYSEIDNLDISPELKEDMKAEYHYYLGGFLGSGTTLIACEQLGRTCYGMEISPQYCQVIIDRWEKLTGQKAERVDGN